MSENETLPRRPLRWWDLGVAAVMLVLLIPGGFGILNARGDEVAGLDGLPLALALLGVFLVLYAALMRPALRRAERGVGAPGRDAFGLASLIVFAGLATAVTPGFAVLQAVLYPMIWTISSPRDGGWAPPIWWSGALAAAIGGGSYVAYHRYGVSHGVWTAAVIAACSFAFAVFLGIWLRRVYAQSERHRALAEQLRASQAEVAALSEASGASAERERLSRELHDTLTQTLTGLVMLSEQAERALVAGDTERALDRTGRVGTAAREAVGEARALVATTQPLGDGELVAALERIAARLQADAGLRVECHLEEVTLEREQEVLLLRAAQEGLANARRHSGADRVVLALRPSERGGAELTISDDGVGPSARLAEGDPGGFGLSGLADRARALGGEVRFGPGKPGGACLVVSTAGGGGRLAAGAGSGAASDPEPGAGAESGIDADVGPGRRTGQGSAESRGARA